MNFQKRDSTEESFVAVKPQVAQPRDEEDESDRLSDILAAYGGGKRQEIQESYHQHVHLAPDMPKAERKNEYFIPVDYDTYQAWLHQKKDFDHVAHIRNAVNVIPKATKRITKPIVALHDEADPGDDTSQDAADLISQESKEEKQLDHLEPAVKVIAHPDRVNQSPNSASLKKTIENGDSDIEARKKSISPMLEETIPDSPVKDKDEVVEERDENFVLESDLNEKLYSSESESQPPQDVPKVLTKPRKLSLSSSSSSVLPPAAVERKKEMPKKLQIQTESESSTATKKKQSTKIESEVSGPEMDNDDDFWN